jgi:glycosyltransferase involved in cell wall biosynthesis
MGKLENLDKTGVSIVVCSYNGKDRIKPTLEHLAKQRNINFPCEILLVDNNSSDDTSSIALDVWKSLSCPFDLRVISETKPGTMYARKAGIIFSRYRYMLFCDDDNWLGDNYVRRAYEIISSNNEIAAVGGTGVALGENNAVMPLWLLDYESAFGTGPQARHDGDTTNDKGCLYTAGAIMDRIWLDKLYTAYGFTSSLKGRDGKSLVAGEDTELTFALKLIGGRLFYSSSLQFIHFMPLVRTSWRYFRRLNTSIGRSSFLLSPYQHFFSSRKGRAISEILLQKAYIYIVLYIRALAVLFRANHVAVIRYDRAKGELREAFLNTRTFLSNRKMVHTLYTKSQSSTRAFQKDVAIKGGFQPI